MMIEKLRIGAFVIMCSAVSVSASAQQLPGIGGLPLAGDVLGGDLLGGGVPVLGSLLGGDLLGGGLPLAGDISGGGLPLVGEMLGESGLPFGIEGTAVLDEVLGLVLDVGTGSLSGGGL